MKNFSYALKQVLKIRGMVLLKLLSLTMGFTIAGFMFTYVVFMSSYDSYMPDSNRLYSLRVKYDIANVGVKYSDKMMAPIVPLILDKVGGVESGTRFLEDNDREIRVGENVFSVKVYIADSLFFKTMGYKVLRGVPTNDMNVAGNVFVSETLARNMCGTSDPLGFNFISEGEPHVIRGVFEDIPDNSTYKIDMVVPLLNARTGFDGGDSWFSYLKLKQGVDTATVSRDINRNIEPHLSNWEKDGYKLDFFVKPIKEVYYDEVKDTILILSILSLVLILVSGLNYVLLSLSSLSVRAKEMGVHKVSGGGKATIFGIIIWETFIYIVLSIILSGILLWAFKVQFENLTQVDLWSVFSLSNFWTIGVMILLMLIVAGVFPAWVFSRIPVVEIFRNSTNLRNRWKQALLFFQFASSAFALCFLTIIVKQHKEMIWSDLGYDYSNLVVMRMSLESDDFDLLANNLRQQSFVKGLTFSGQLPLEGLSGAMFAHQNDTITNPISIRYLMVDTAFLDVYQIRISEGSGDLSVNGNIVVNKEFVNVFGGNLNPLSMVMVCDEISGDFPLKVSGVMDNFRVGNLKYKNKPATFWVLNLNFIEARHQRYITMRLSDLSEHNISTLLNETRSLFPNEKIDIKTYQQIMSQFYSEDKSLQDGILLGSFVLLIITILGVVGYVATEVKRKSKEIAIRRVHGSSSWKIIGVVLFPLLIISFISTSIGLSLSGYFSSYWLENFAYQTEVHWFMFFSVLLLLLSILSTIVIITSWKIANQPPSLNIKKE